MTLYIVRIIFNNYIVNLNNHKINYRCRVYSWNLLSLIVVKITGNGTGSTNYNALLLMLAGMIIKIFTFLGQSTKIILNISTYKFKVHDCYTLSTVVSSSQEQGGRRGWRMLPLSESSELLSRQAPWGIVGSTQSAGDGSTFLLVRATVWEGDSLESELESVST